MTKEDYYRIRDGVYKSAGKDTFNFDLMMVRIISKAIEEERQRKAWNAEYWTAYEKDVAAAEREACAALCFQMWNTWMNSEDKSEFTRPDAEDCAAQIRARGQE